MITGDVLEHVYAEYDGPVELACGASKEQTESYNTQKNLTSTAIQQAQQEFGSASSVFNSLYNSFAPIVNAGPNQKGFSAAEDSALKSGAITNTGEAYRHASTAVKEAGAAVGGGNEYLPGGAEIGRNIEVANEGAERTADSLNKIDQANYETGRENYFKAAEGLNAAPGAFGTANSGMTDAIGSGEDQAKTANDIAAANNSWVSSVTGALGGIGGAVVSGGMSNLGKGKGFFG
jgi:hypothetical protein